MKKYLLISVLLAFLSVSCSEREQESDEPDVSFTPCRQTKASSAELSGRVVVEFTDIGVQITHYDFEVTCDFTAVNVTHTFVNGVLSIAQQGSPDKANCVCYTDVSYTIAEVLEEEVNVIFINGAQTHCYDHGYALPCFPLSAGFCVRRFSFFEAVTKYYTHENVYIIKGIALEAYEYGRNIMLMEDLKGNFPEDISSFLAWGDGFGVIESARFVNLASDFEEQDILIMILTTYDDGLAKLWENLRHFELLGVPFLEKPEDMRIVGCSTSVLKLSDGYVTGNISGNGQSTMGWSEFFKRLQDIFTLLN